MTWACLTRQHLGETKESPPQLVVPGNGVTDESVPADLVSTRESERVDLDREPAG